MKGKRKIILLVSLALLVVLCVIGSIGFFRYAENKKTLAEREKVVREYYNNKLEIYATENSTYDDYAVDVAFLGDSLTDGYNLAQYYPQLVTANRGIGGETTHGLEARLKISVYDLCPKVAVMLIGGNNLDTMLDNYEDILVGLRDNLPQTKVVLISLTAMGKDWAHKNQLATYNNVTVKKLAQKYGFTFVDMFTPLFNEQTGEIYDEYTTDGAHLTALGYEVFTDVLTPVLQTLLQ